MKAAEQRQKRLDQARKRAELARLRFTTALDGTRRRLSFGRLKEDALVAANDKVDEAKANVRQSIRRHPFMVVSVVLGGVAFMFWSPARHLSRYGMRLAQLFWLNRKMWSSNDD